MVKYGLPIGCPYTSSTTIISIGVWSICIKSSGYFPAGNIPSVFLYFLSAILALSLRLRTSLSDSDWILERTVFSLGGLIFAFLHLWAIAIYVFFDEYFCFERYRSSIVFLIINSTSSTVLRRPLPPLA